MTTPILWMEAKCSYIHTKERSMSCHQTSFGIFARSPITAIKFIKATNWVLIEGNWVCPECYKKNYT